MFDQSIPSSGSLSTMTEFQAPAPLMQQDHSREYDLEAIRAFDEKYPEYADDSFSGCLDAVSTSQKAVQADECPTDGQAQHGPSNEKIQWVEKNDFFDDQDVASIFENAVAGIESSIIESSVIGNHQVDLSGDSLVPLPSWALNTNRQKNARVDGEQQFPHDFDSFEPEHWEFYTQQILNDETMMTKSWDDLICWLNESWIKLRADEKAAKIAKASEECSHVDHGQNDHGSNSAPQRSESRSHLGDGQARYPMAPPQRNGTNGAAPSPYQNTNASGGNPKMPSRSNLQYMSNQNTPSHRGVGLQNGERLQHSQREYNNGRARPVQGPVQQGCNPKTQYQQSQVPSVGHTNHSQSKPTVRHQGPVHGMNGAPKAQHQQLHDSSTGNKQNGHLTPPVQQQALVKGINGTPRARYQQPHGPFIGNINNSQSKPPVQQEGCIQGMNGTPRYQLSTLGPGGRKDREVPRQILGRRGREAIEDDDVVELDPSVYASQFPEDGARSKRRRNNANPGTSTEPRLQRRQNKAIPRPQYYGAAGAPVPAGLPEERSGITRPTSGFVGDATRPCVPQKAIDSNGRVATSNQGSYAPIQGPSNVGPSSSQRPGRDNLAKPRMSGGRNTTSVPRSYSDYLQPTPSAHQAQKIPDKRGREELVGGLAQNNYNTQQNHGVEGPEEGNGDRHKQAQDGRNSTFGPPQLSTDRISNTPNGPQPSCPQQTNNIVSEGFHTAGLEPEGDMQPKISRKRDFSQFMTEPQEDSQEPGAKRRRTPSTEAHNLPPGAPRREKPKRPKTKRDEHLPPPLFHISDGANNASPPPRPAAMKEAEQILPAPTQPPHVANAPAPDPPHAPTTAPTDQPHAPDIRDTPPATEWECIRLSQALDHTRWAYEQWTGADAPPTNRLHSYNAQFATVFAAFDAWWRSSANPEFGQPMAWLVQVEAWEGGVADWKAPGREGVFWECVRRGFWAGRGADGGLAEPDFRWDLRDYGWFDGGDEALMG